MPEVFVKGAKVQQHSRRRLPLPDSPLSTESLIPDGIQGGQPFFGSKEGVVVSALPTDRVGGPRSSPAPVDA